MARWCCFFLHSITYLFKIQKPNALPLYCLGAAMEFKDFVKDQPDGTPYAHMNYDLQFQWDSKDGANDKDNGFICKRAV